MRIVEKTSCETCNHKCDIFLTSKEMRLEQELHPRQVVYKKHESICRQNAVVTHAIILSEGDAKMYIEGINGKNIILNILMPSNYIGLLAVFGSPNYSYNVSALTTCHTCHIDIETIKKLYYHNHNFLIQLNQAFCGSVSAIMKKLISLNQKQLRGKVAESLIYLSQLYGSNNFSLTITRKELGELSAISEENAVRVLTEFKNEGIIGLNGKMIEILDLAVLQKINSIG